MVSARALTVWLRIVTTSAELRVQNGISPHRNGWIRSSPDDRVGAVRKGADAARRGELFDQIGPAAVMPGQLLRSGCEVNMVTHGEWN